MKTRTLTIIAIALLLSLTSCMDFNDPQSTTTEGNGFKVEYLFTKDSVNVYRFYDGGRTHYFTSKGETITTQTAGKTHYDENIQ